MPSAANSHRVELTEFERVVHRGIAKQTWSVKLSGRWVACTKVAGAIVVSGPSHAGVVWEHRVTLELHSNTLLRATHEAPLPQRRQDVFRFLTLATRATSRVQRIDYRVDSHGSLQRQV